ncbi:MAG: DNA mismatch repair endonuclease MutL, partial [Oscillospiraceae bacterium]|nr:DNA mismatch repair endonuclease MutL [Oscillospiraceae bacterium]
MPIQLLSRDITERIAAGEVVERPASVVKELAENSIDAGAKLIEVELVSNGLSMIRITDDGSGIQKSEVPIAFKRHATSKISEESDLERITTLGFRGEALSAISAVSRVRMISRTENDEFATEYRIDGGAELSLTDTGADVGTTIMVNDLFYNTPARMKFLKKDVSEGNSVYAAVLQLALSHPEISFRLIRDGRVTLNTPGNGDLYSVIYAVFPKEIAENLLGVSERSVRVSVSGYIGKIELSRRSRGFQYAFVNGRFVKSATITAAVEQAYKKWKPKERFPVFVLNVDILPEDVDVNVHPAKTQVRFQSEKEVFSAVYRAVQGSLDSSARDICVQSWKTVKSSELSDAGEASVDSGYRDRVFSRGEDYTESEDSLVSFVGLQEDEVSEISVLRNPVSAYGTDINETAQDVVRFSLTKQTETDITVTQEEIGQRIPGDGLRVIGELFETYIVAELTERMVLIDKHAAHERILFEQFNGADPDDI